MYFVDPSKKRIDIEINGAQDFCYSFVLPELRTCDILNCNKAFIGRGCSFRESEEYSTISPGYRPPFVNFGKQ